MYDTIILELERHETDCLDFISHVCPKLSNVTKFVTNDIYESHLGYLDGTLQVNVSQNKLRIPKGNLRAWYFKHPFYIFRREDVQDAIAKLEDSLGVPLTRSRIKRLDIGPILSMEHPAKEYLKHLGPTTGYKRLDQDNGVTFKGKWDSFCVYHKQNQLLETHKEIPSDKQNGNHLKPELRVKRNLNGYFQRQVSIADLYDESFYIGAIDQWQKVYKRITKLSSMINSIEPTGSSKKFVENLACAALSSGNHGKIYNLIKEWQSCGYITPKQAYDHRRKLKELNDKSYKDAQSELMAELDVKIERAAIALK